MAAWLVHRLHPRVMGTLVGTVVLLTNARIVLLAGGMSGPVRLACLMVLTSVCGTVLVRTALTLPRETVEPLAPRRGDTPAALPG